MKLSELSDETLLYVEIFNDLKTIIPEGVIITKKECVNNPELFCKAYWYEIFLAVNTPVAFYLENFLEEVKSENGVDDDWVQQVINELRETIDIDEFEGKVNKVLAKHRVYTAGELVENDIWREEKNENRD